MSDATQQPSNERGCYVMEGVMYTSHPDGSETSRKATAEEVLMADALLRATDEQRIWMDATNEWIKANGPGGWIDDLRKRATHEPFVDHPHQVCSCGAKVPTDTYVLHTCGDRLTPQSAPPPVPEWQPIETAPKDGTDLLLAKIVGHIDHPTALWWLFKGSWSLKWNKWWDGIEPCGLSGPTHWMPIPRVIAPTKTRCGVCSPAEFGGPLCACHTQTKGESHE